MSENFRSYEQSRRLFIQSIAVTGVAASVGGMAAAQESEEIELEAYTPGWIGVAPAEIEGEENPTLQLESGQTYAVTIENVDGIPHNFAIINEAGEQLVRSEFVDDAGDTTTVEFEATDDMDVYYCEPHADTMRGDIEIVDVEEPDVEELPYEGVPVAGEFPEGETVGLQRVAEGMPALTDFEYVEGDAEERLFVVTQTGQIYAHRPNESTEDTDENPDNQEFVFDGFTEAWIGVEPAEIEGEENPTLELEIGQQYTFTWENADGLPHNIAIHDADGNALESTEVIEEEGATQSLEFEATEEMATYICEVHPTTMSGDIDVVEAAETPPPGEEAEETPTPEDEPVEETPTPDEEETPTPEEEETPTPDEEETPTPDEEPVGEPIDVPTPDDMELFLDISDRMVDLGLIDLGGYDERGLLGLAFHPEFTENRKFYVRYSAPIREGTPEDFDHTDLLSEFEADENLESADPDTERVIMEIPQPQDNHNGGNLEFGPDGYLYTSVGDGGNVHDIGLGHVDDWYDENEGGNGQDTQENLLGGIHRIDVDPDSEEEADGPENGAYEIPADNPFVEGQELEGEGLEEYYAWGFRNPFGMSVDEEGTVFTTDAGQHAIESAYVVERGGNYSWNVKEGSFCFSPDSPLEPPAECPDETPEDVRGGEPLRDPIVEFRHRRITEAFIDSSVVTGGRLYEGEAVPELQGSYVFTNWSAEGIVAADGEILVATRTDDVGEPEVDDEDAIDDDEDELDDEDAIDDDEDELDDEDPIDDEEEEVDNDVEDEVEDEQWELTELVIEGADDESLNRYAYGVHRDAAGELYVVTNTDYTPDGEGGEIFRIVPADEGEEIAAPEDVQTVEEDEVEDDDVEEDDDMEVDDGEDDTEVDDDEDDEDDEGNEY